jgi:hypothetical protein
VGFVVVGTAYGWDVTARGYSRWTQVIGVVAVIALGGVVAWGRRGEPLLAGAVAAGAIALAAAYVVMHRRLSARVRALLVPGQTDIPDDSER